MIEGNPKKSEEQKTILAEIEGIIDQSPEKVEVEFLRTANTWLDCFIDRLFPIETYLNIKTTAEEFGSAEEYQSALSRLEELKDIVLNLKEQYPNQDTIPPDDVKEELFTSLKNII